jgi:hypothetical protein
MRKFPSVSKLEAARRHLETAALLHFNSGDPVPIHTLVAAAYGVLEDRAAKQSSKMLITGSFDETYLGPELSKDLKAAMRKLQNYFKHSDRANEPESIEYSPSFTHLMLLDACVKLFELTGERPTILAAFEAWCLVHFQELRQMLLKEQVYPEQERRRLEQLSPQAFLQEFMQHNLSLPHGDRP